MGEKIVAAAILAGDVALSMPAPARHHDIIHSQARMNRNCHGMKQGFLTSEGRFVDRRKAIGVAEDAGQEFIDEPLGGQLFSECLW